MIIGLTANYDFSKQTNKNLEEQFYEFGNR